MSCAKPEDRPEKDLQLLDIHGSALGLTRSQKREAEGEKGERKSIEDPGLEVTRVLALECSLIEFHPREEVQEFTRLRAESPLQNRLRWPRTLSQHKLGGLKETSRASTREKEFQALEAKKFKTWTILLGHQVF